MVVVRGRQRSQSGDVVEYRGQCHHVAGIERRQGRACAVAFDAAGWAIALGHELVDIHPAA